VGKEEMKSIELFSGSGGLAKGLEIAGFDHLAFVEHNKDACASLRRNFASDRVFEGDIRAFELSGLGKVDIVAGGPPCQPFSLGGRHGADNDARDMFPHAIKTIERLKPKAFVFENVKGLLRQSFSEYFSYIILRLEYPDFVPAYKEWQRNLHDLRALDTRKYGGVKYIVHWKLLNAADYGVPQTRERVVIVGIRADLDLKWEFPRPSHSKERLLWDQFVTGEYWKRHNLPATGIFSGCESVSHKSSGIRHSYGIFPPEGNPWQTIRDCLMDVPAPQLPHSIPDHIFKDGARSYPGHTGSEIDSPAKTIKAGGHGVPGGENMTRFEDGSIRYLTVYEAKLLQTFPKDFVICGAWGEAMRQIGNAVPVLLAESIGCQLYSLLSHAASIGKAA
jgi:DNA (cytosine-5)-methyltransferase 1